MPKDFVTVADWSADELWPMIDRALVLRQNHRSGKRERTLEGRTLAMYFEKPSLRTHVTFEAGMSQLGGHAILLKPDQIGIGTRESPEDVARSLSRWVDCLVARTFSHELVEQLARDATIPVVNGLTDLLHPCQAMADLVTIAGVMKPTDATIAYVGDGNNVANSLILIAAVLGLRVRVATPASHPPTAKVLAEARRLALDSGAEITIGDDPVAAVKGVDFVYTDTWTSMGQEEEAEQRRKLFRPYQVNAELLDGARSLVFDQAENRLHAQNAILERLLTD
jgi:ornithine carbamoyltransferase